MTAKLKFSGQTKFQQIKLTIFALLLIHATWPVECINDAEELKNNVDKVSVSNHTINDKPIIIQTQARDYDEPNLKEYETCHINRDKCMKVCETHTNVEQCESECPQCPILIKHDVAVQGVNDTEFRQPANTPGNTTNVIKLVNEIHNVIDTSQNITANNENNIVVHQNISTTGGKFGMGYTDKGPCCTVIRRSSKCDGSSSSGNRRRRGSMICPQKRHRLCSEKHCRAPVMRAKPIHYCTLDEDGTENCNNQPKFEYIPYVRPRRSTRPRCSYTPQWPYVRCMNTQQPNKNICQRCLAISYGEILQNGLPNACQSCFASPMSSNVIWYPSYQYYPPQPEPYFPNLDDSWQVEKLKCRFPDGTITDCGPGVTVVDDQDQNISDFPDRDNDYDISDLPSDLTDFNNSDYSSPNDKDTDADYLRRRRQINKIFKRSKYSLRHRD